MTGDFVTNLSGLSASETLDGVWHAADKRLTKRLRTGAASPAGAQGSLNVMEQTRRSGDLQSSAKSPVLLDVTAKFEQDVSSRQPLAAPQVIFSVVGYQQRPVQSILKPMVTMLNQPAGPEVSCTKISLE